ncbi:hypothetical protein [Alkalibacillus haloalkaliphilus]|uniref:Uncharacterized protein n=1 Tax=Alkalibacillus haloalkaliphilus TaxID=94136 RepID=A0A511W661_9BACI|nr:hypothetical protein [Alkalibacillus haloalkaliphilus]GEN45543.1 hypothetical protein AHA02nite_13190 [Alkalibacillus haloalkaliphilus]
MTKPETALLKRIAERQLEGDEKREVALDALLLYMLKLEGESMESGDNSQLSSVVDELIKEERNQLEEILTILKGEG